MERRQHQRGRSPEAYQRGEHSRWFATATCARERSRSALVSQHNTSQTAAADPGARSWAPPQLAGQAQAPSRHQQQGARHGEGLAETKHGLN